MLYPNILWGRVEKKMKKGILAKNKMSFKGKSGQDLNFKATFIELQETVEES